MENFLENRMFLKDCAPAVSCAPQYKYSQSLVKQSWDRYARNLLYYNYLVYSQLWKKKTGYSQQSYLNIHLKSKLEA